VCKVGDGGYEFATAGFDLTAAGCNRSDGGYEVVHAGSLFASADHDIADVMARMRAASWTLRAANRHESSCGKWASALDNDDDDGRVDD
jgi:hypothetical protein